MNKIIKKSLKSNSLIHCIVMGRVWTSKSGESYNFKYNDKNMTIKKQILTGTKIKSKWPSDNDLTGARLHIHEEDVWRYDSEVREWYRIETFIFLEYIKNNIKCYLPLDYKGIKKGN